MSKKAIIFGVGELADLLLFYLTNDSNYKVEAFTVDKSYKKGDIHSGLPLIEFENIEKYYPPEKYCMFVAIGYKDLNFLRSKKYIEAKYKGYKLGTYISSTSTYWKNIEI